MTVRKLVAKCRLEVLSEACRVASRENSRPRQQDIAQPKSAIDGRARLILESPIHPFPHLVHIPNTCVDKVLDGRICDGDGGTGDGGGRSPKVQSPAAS